MDETDLSFNRPPIRGRGSSYNPANRFDQISIEPDPELDQPHPLAGKTEYFRDTTRKIITYNDSPDVGFEASVNPYRGCEHGCIYCYARPGHEYFGLSSGLDFETKIFVKTEAPVLLRNELAKRSWKPQVLVMSGVTDPYQPVERQLNITRKCLEVLLDFRNPVAIITKNSLVTRDIDILKEMQKHQCCAVNISVTSLDKTLRQKLEPRTSIPSDRLRAIETLTKHHIPVNVMVAPLIPGLNDHEIPAILKAAAQAGAVQAAYTLLRLPYAVKDLFEQWLTQHFPDRKSKILNRLRSLRAGKLYDSRFGQRMRGQGAFAEQIRQLFKIHCKRVGLNAKPIKLSVEHFRRHDPRQHTLF